MSHRQFRTIAAVIVAVSMGIIGFAGCGLRSDNSSATSDGRSSVVDSQSDDSQQQHSFTDKEGIQKEYQQSLAQLQFPEGFTPPETMNEQLLQADSYEKGFGDSAVSFVWVCAWEQDWLDHYATDEQAAAVALEQLGKAKDMPFMQGARVDDNTREYMQTNLDKAALGDASGIQQDVDANCTAAQ
ncbi:hypothetical protein [Bifidobacterium oedipodis]|uniref:Lipoprotein n=1 Tax=Bifidobacterium oedipodis TaxID=2675322 RepID=A0A7Y0HT28_9BIFI|nr:hypothetical protein [Bifidobacterium sp. DSM 109957]NMM93677.1 hypothetical protein [Bifidobacterium sp. DSM 109957]